MPVLTTPTIQELPELVGPDYNLFSYRPDLFKVVRFKSTVPRCGPVHRKKDDGYKHSDKLPQSLSRARRVVLELALCNDWTWFGTLTIAPNNYDRKNLQDYYKKFYEWIKYLRKKHGLKIPYLLVPEQHGDGSWHMHGFFNSDIDQFLIPFKDIRAAGENVPWKLVKNVFYNWPRYQKRFGFCSFGRIRNHDATAFYATKYISKSFQGDAQRVGLRLYYPSEGLNHASFYDSVYGPCAELDVFLQNHYEYCSTGFVSFNREPGDDPLLDILEMQHDRMFPMTLDSYTEEDFEDVVEYYEVTQEMIADYY